MNDFNSIINWLKMNQFQPTHIIENYLLSKKLTINDIKTLSCLWYESKKTYIRGNKKELISQFIREVESVKNHYIILKYYKIF